MQVFTVVDLETTGGSPAADAITEIGAVRLREDGVIEAQFQTLVDPLRPIAGFVSALTGITDEMVAQSPTVEDVLPTFLEFARDSVLVAHNAPFDIGFLRAAASQCDIEWPLFHVVDTVTLARRTLHRGEVPNHKLATLASYFCVRVLPNHRALADARATADVLLALLNQQRATVGFGS
ncbi:MAG TPA: exonuclease domain-containing protein [Jatrophihabitans sp.]